MARFWTSDHHFNHANVIKYCKRPYTSVEEMNADLVKKWNETVKPDDTVWYLGDFEMGKRTLSVVKELNGQINLIPGNHDACFPGHKKWMKEEIRYKDSGFKYIFASPQEVELFGVKLLMWHLPYSVPPTREYKDVRYEQWRLLDKGQWLLHGHVHEKWKKRGKMINVGVDVWGFRPVSEGQIAALIEEDEIEPWEQHLL